MEKKTEIKKVTEDRKKLKYPKINKNPRKHESYIVYLNYKRKNLNFEENEMLKRKMSPNLSKNEVIVFTRSKNGLNNFKEKMKEIEPNKILNGYKRGKFKIKKVCEEIIIKNNLWNTKYKYFYNNFIIILNHMISQYEKLNKRKFHLYFLNDF